MDNFDALVAACTQAASDLWSYRQTRGGPIHYLPLEVNEALNMAKGEYSATGVAVRIGNDFAFHARPAIGDHWSGQLEWPDTQTTPGMTWELISDTLVKKGVPEEWLADNLSNLGTTVQWESEVKCYCATQRLLIQLPADATLPADWYRHTKETLLNLLRSHEETLVPVNYHVAAVLWLCDENRQTMRANLRQYLSSLPAGPLD